MFINADDFHMFFPTIWIRILKRFYDKYLEQTHRYFVMNAKLVENNRMNVCWNEKYSVLGLQQWWFYHAKHSVEYDKWLMNMIAFMEMSLFLEWCLSSLWMSCDWLDGFQQFFFSQQKKDISGDDLTNHVKCNHEWIWIMNSL